MAPRDRDAAGVDAGATLTKLVLPGAGGDETRTLPSDAPEAVLAALEACAADRVGITGGGAARLLAEVPGAVAVEEFDAWHAGVQELLDPAVVGDERFLLVSIGTGTSVMLVEGERVQRLGGTPLGGGTVLGLGGPLAGTSDFASLCRLAEAGDRANVDLSVADVYAGSEAPLATDVMASSFARLADGPHGGGDSHPEDRARSLMAMVGENVALLAGSLSLVVNVERIVFGGSTLEGNATLRHALRDYVGRFGREPVFLAQGAFAGAYGARRLAAA